CTLKDGDWMSTAWAMQDPVVSDTMADGSFQVAAVFSTDTDLLVEHPDRVTHWQHLEPAGDPRPGIDVGVITLKPGRLFRSRVVDVSGRPVAGARIGLHQGTYHWTRHPTAAADGGVGIGGL